jgi:hypothetical protein
MFGRLPNDRSVPHQEDAVGAGESAGRVWRWPRYVGCPEAGRWWPGLGQSPGSFAACFPACRSGHSFRRCRSRTRSNSHRVCWCPRSFRPALPSLGFVADPEAEPPGVVVAEHPDRHGALRGDRLGEHPRAEQLACGPGVVEAGHRCRGAVAVDGGISAARQAALLTTAPSCAPGGLVTARRYRGGRSAALPARNASSRPVRSTDLACCGGLSPKAKSSPAGPQISSRTNRPTPRPSTRRTSSPTRCP